MSTSSSVPAFEIAEQSEIENRNPIVPCVCPAVVLDSNSESREVLARLVDREPSLTVWAKVAIESPLALQANDRVLLSIASQDEAFVIGVLQRQNRVKQVIQLANGESVVVDADSSAIEITSAQQTSVVRYNGATQDLKVSAEGLNVSLDSTCGDLSLVASGKVRVSGGEAIQLETPQISILAEHTELQGKSLEAVHDRTRFVSRRIDWIAETFLSTCKNAYQNISELFQVRAGRARVMAEQAAEFKAREVRIRSEDDVKVEGKHIHLG